MSAGLTHGDGLVRDVLGYLNLSSGRRDAAFLERLNALYELAESAAAAAPWAQVEAWLLAELTRLAGRSAAFEQTEQAARCLELVFHELWPAYRRWHADLLAHQPDERLLGPYFVARMFEATLAQGAPWDESARIVSGALDELNDFLGYRPVAVLRTPQKIEPYPHEWVAPIPLAVRGAPPAAGCYRDIIAGALAILQSSDPDLLAEAGLDLARLDELALDPRAYDFEHPVNKRPNHLFGEWDPHSVDQHGYYRRFVVREAPLAALLPWVCSARTGERDERLFEAAAVVAGTILMASGTSGWGPEAHDSTVSLATLVPRIADYRDRFYSELIARQTGDRARRLQAEAAELRQPFAGVRGYLNAELARQRADQLTRSNVALMFAQLGDTVAAEEYASQVATPAARLQTRIECQFWQARRALSAGRPAGAVEPLRDVGDLLRRGIDCGALIDPWNLLGFQGQFSLFPAVENSVADPRADQLCRLVRTKLGLDIEAWTAAAAGGERQTAERCAAAVAEWAAWWDQFATASVGGIAGFSAQDLAASAERVSEALERSRVSRIPGGDVAFWRQEVTEFEGPSTYALALAAVMAQRAWLPAMGLLSLWLLDRGEAPLEQADASFDHWAGRWLEEVTSGAGPPASSSADRWTLVARFFDSLEANAEEFWNAPTWETPASGEHHELPGELPEDFLEDDQRANLFLAAYESMSFRDSTGDGVESDMLDGAGPPAREGALDFEARRLAPHLSFLVTLAKLWRRCAAGLHAVEGPPPAPIVERLPAWQSHAEALRRGLIELALEIQAQALAEPLPTREALLDFDRRRAVQEALVERVQWAAWEVSLAEIALRLANPAAESEPSASWPAAAIELVSRLAAGDREAVQRRWAGFLRVLARQPLLYVPTAKGGDPRLVFTARLGQSLLCVLADRLPRAGLLVESCQLLDAVLERERRGSPGPGAVSEFDRFFETGYRALLETLLQAPAGGAVPKDRPGRSPRELVELVQRWNHALLSRWLAHSRLVRLSALEQVTSPARWQQLVEFVSRHGAGLFTQSFLNLGHLRSIRHQGVEAWLERISARPDAEEDYPFLADLDRGTPRKQAVECLSLVIDAVGENYAYYPEYNSTTTQSDRGENLYMFLDFLRLLASYDRICWNMRPLVAAHDVLLADGDGEAAALWRESLAERTAEAADSHLTRYAELVRQYGLRLPSVYERLSERFVRPLAIDRLRTLVQPAVQEGRAGRPGPALAQLREEIDELLEAPAGSGVEVPGWLAALRDEVASQEEPRRRVRFLEELPAGPIVRLSWDQIVEQLEAWEEASGDP